MSSDESSTSSDRRRGSSSSASSWGSISDGSSETSSTADDEEDAYAAETAKATPFTGLSCVLLSLVFTAAVVLALVLINTKGSGSSSSGSGSGNGSSSSSGPSASSTGESPFRSKDVQSQQAHSPGIVLSDASTYTGSVPAAATTIPVDFLSSLASSYSMTPASISTLTMPSAALPSASSALSYISSAWPFQKGSSEYLTFAEDPLDSGGGTVVQVEYEKGSYSGTDDPGGGVGNLQLGVFGEGKNRAMVSYEVGFDRDFAFVEGGKLPGSYGGDMNAYCTGGQPSAACFSLRLMWRADGAGEVYGYVPTYEDQCSSDVSATDVFCHGDDGLSFNRGSWTFETGVYNTVTEIAILNSNPGTPCEANGVLAVYAGETLAFERTDVVFRTNASVFFTSLAFSTFFGGSSTSYASTGNVYTYFKNFQFFEGDDASTETGSIVTATIPSASSTGR
ncbi:hypothetical protein JCM1840_004406 [Sporobolomyces johnsonii]